MKTEVKSVHGQSWPLLFCDTCGERIETGNQGVVNTPSLSDSAGAQGTRFCHRNGKCGPESRADSCIPLHIFLVNLTRSLHIDFDEVLEGERYKAMMS